MKNFILVLLGIIVALLIVGGALGYTIMNDAADNSEDSAVEKIVDKVSNVASSESSDNESDSDIVSEEVKFNAQNGEGYYREVTYRDGGFRQFDNDTGELIGSSYDSDQDKLPSME